MDMNVIKSYLVQLGAKIDDTSWNQTVGKVKELEKTIETVTSSMSKSFTTASSAITGALIGVTTATGGLLDHVSQLDMGYQKFALSMYMSTKQAKELKIVTDAMGENINDIAWIPELRQRYMSLMQETQTLEGQIPGGGEAMMRGIRDIRFEFTRLKVEATYALQWIAMYLDKYLSNSLGNFKGGMKDLNNWLVSNMPVWTKKVADFLGAIITTIWKLLPSLDDVTNWIKNIPDNLQKLENAFKNSKDVIIEFGVILVAAFSGATLPITILSGLIAGVMVHLKEIDGANVSWSYFGDMVKEGTKKFDDFTKSIAISIEKHGALPQLVQMFKDLGGALSDIDDALTMMLKSLGLLHGQKGALAWLSDEFVKILTGGMRAVSFLAHLVSALAKLTMGNTAGAKKDLDLAIQDAWGNPNKPVTGGDSKSSGGSGGGTTSDNMDADVLRRKIAAQETHGDPTATSNDNAHFGKYQFAQSTWDSIARDANRPNLVGVDPRNASVEDQDYLASVYIKELIDQGYTASQIAGVWYAGEGSLTWSDAARSRQQSNGPSLNDYTAGVLAQEPTPTSYNPSLMAKASLLNNYTVGTGANAASSIDQSTTTGNINIYITEPGANQDQIKSAVMAGIKQANNKSNARMIDNFAGVGVTMV